MSLWNRRSCSEGLVVFVYCRIPGVVTVAGRLDTLFTKRKRPAMFSSMMMYDVLHEYLEWNGNGMASEEY